MYKNLNPGAVHIRCGWIEGLDLAQDASFQGADLNIGEAQKLAEAQGAGAVIRVYEERGLKIGGWGLPVNWRGTDAQFYEDMAKLPAAAALAAEGGCHRTATCVLSWHEERTSE